MCWSVQLYDYYCVFFLVRAACHLKLEEYAQAIEQCNEVRETQSTVYHRSLALTCSDEN